TSIGSKCNIFTGAVIGSITQDLKFKGDKSFVKIGDNNTIREYTTVNRGTQRNSVTKIGNNNMIMAYTHIAHDCHIGSSVIIANCGTLAGYVTIEDRAILGGLVGVHQFVRIGALAIIGGCSKVVKHIPPYSMSDGHPAKVYGLNTIGLRRAGISGNSRAKLRYAFRILINSGLSLPHALKKIDKTVPSCKEVKNLVHFLKTVKADTQRGACK
ncbi:MAG: acyl-ACP--UDP-N-acetylglucosamine O-acyltransferase, partial [Candidatus Omnitrophica bacterium]|nr:acyl-ACP--UDP-N-acetylglucosamine O-acyltransferase [Candidatus Omnitrophota bacterium]